MGLPAAAGFPAAAAAAAAAVVPKVAPEPCLLLASRPLDAAAELALQLEYTAGEKNQVFGFCGIVLYHCVSAACQQAA
jgi:hypothetical protein